MRCRVCPRACDLAEGQTGFCRARANRGGRLVCLNYGRLTSLALDPVEKKPFARFMPGSLVLSAGSFGCNLRCPFCQNHSISMSGEEAETFRADPGQLARLAAELAAKGNIGLAYTYNEPLVGYEFVMDTAAAVRSKGMKNLLVTNGLICPEPLAALLPLIDAVNIDLKGPSDSFYAWLQGGAGSLDAVLGSIESSLRHCHVEVTCLIIPGKNDDPDDMRRLARRLGEISRSLPLHLTRFQPRWRCLDLPPATAAKTRELAEAARESLDFVYGR
ncbi:MAG: AmmeMemoRadiSam system radical SAM enzyme [Clostridiales Family XIII bacterium]|jgi:pyruvate formate lyase activating enzyme|nr:AmmeMemoRadiSam system radical SAM enzyme [Clostridiales Family XIII bacterium]